MNIKQKEIYKKYNATGLYGREQLIKDCWKEAQKELLNEILNEVNLTKGNWSDIIEKKLVSLDTNNTSNEEDNK